MKRLTPALSLFFAMLIDSAGSAQSTDTEHMLNLNDCRIMLIFARVWNKSPLIQRENATWIVVNSQGEYESKDWYHTPQRRKQEWDGPLPHQAVALAHTHPDHLDPKPSEQDGSVARKIQIPLYTLTRKGIWKVTANSV